MINGILYNSRIFLGSVYTIMAMDFNGPLEASFIFRCFLSFW